MKELRETKTEELRKELREEKQLKVAHQILGDYAQASINDANIKQLIKELTPVGEPVIPTPTPIQTKKIRKKDGSLTKHAKKALDWCLFEKAKGGKYKVYTKEWSESGGYYSLIDETPIVLALLKERNYKYTEGNDSPQGGQDGYYILISNLAHKYIQQEINKNN